jgi:molecular chaperone Hsp33
MAIEQHDTSISFLFDHCAVRGVWVSLRRAYQEMLALHDYTPHAQCLLGESVAAAALLGRSLKWERRLALQARSEGALRLLVAECTEAGGVRGVIELKESLGTHSQRPLFSTLLEDGYLSLSLIPAEGNAHQGIVPLDGERLQDCIAGYFAQSEQLPTALWLACDGTQAAGLLLQALPDKEREEKEDWRRLQALAHTITDAELLRLPCVPLLQRLFHEESVRVFDPEPLMFFCTCSKERSRNALTVLGADELRSLFAEQPVVEIDCQFCRRKYRYEEKDIVEF